MSYSPARNSVGGGPIRRRAADLRIYCSREPAGNPMEAQTPPQDRLDPDEAGLARPWIWSEGKANEGTSGRCNAGCTTTMLTSSKVHGAWRGQ